MTADPETIAATRERLRTFDRYASSLPAVLPPDTARALLLGLATEIAPGVATEVELALRPVNHFEHSTGKPVQLTAPWSVFDNLTAIESWLREHHGTTAAQRVLGIRSRIAGTLLESATLTLQAEDPMGIELDASSDGTAAVRRFVQGVERLSSLYRRTALAPYRCSGTRRCRAFAPVGRNRQGPGPLPARRCGQHALGYGTHAARIRR